MGREGTKDLIEHPEGRTIRSTPREPPGGGDSGPACPLTASASQLPPVQVPYFTPAEPSRPPAQQCPPQTPPRASEPFPSLWPLSAPSTLTQGDTPRRPVGTSSPFSAGSYRMTHQVPISAPGLLRGLGRSVGSM